MPGVYKRTVIFEISKSDVELLTHKTINFKLPRKAAEKIRTSTSTTHFSLAYIYVTMYRYDISDQSASTSPCKSIYPKDCRKA